MKTKNKNRDGKDGGVLLMALLVLVAFSVLAVGLQHLSTTTGLDAVHQDQSDRAFWIAESGLQDAVQRLRYDEVYRVATQGGSSTFAVSNTTDDTHYDITVTDSGEGNLTIDYYVFDIESVGWMGGMNRRIQQRVTTQPGYISAIMSPGNINIDANTLVTGPIMVLDNGQIILDDKIPPGQDLAGDYDIVILDDDASINDKKSGANQGEDYDVVDLPVPDSLPSMPDFSSYKATAELLPAVSGLVTQGVLNVVGEMYFNCPDGLTIQQITGSGTIVNTGDITIGDGNLGNTDVSSDVAILSFDDIVVTKQSNLGNNILLYGYDTVYFGDSSYCPGNSALLADGNDDGILNDDITMGGQSQFFGIVFADEGNVVIQAGSGGDNNTRIEGTVIGGGDVDMNSNTEIMFNPDVFYGGDMFDLTSFFATEVILTKKTWEELPPL